MLYVRYKLNKTGGKWLFLSKTPVGETQQFALLKKMLKIASLDEMFSR